MILIEPVKTEKAISKIEYENTLTFHITLDASKPQVKEEVEKLFNVKVASVRTFVTAKGEKHALVKLTKEFKADDIATKLKMIA
ncbi:50S ribosomal protein L23 [Candidatus Micrarchaeota archaeon]|nr:50S ribosomal protein L23 [Candidatus Micrarchaeota archaeon]